MITILYDADPHAAYRDRMIWLSYFRMLFLGLFSGNIKGNSLNYIRVHFYFVLVIAHK